MNYLCQQHVQQKNALPIRIFELLFKIDFYADWRSTFSNTISQQGIVALTQLYNNGQNLLNETHYAYSQQTNKINNFINAYPELSEQMTALKEELLDTKYNNMISTTSQYLNKLVEKTPLGQPGNLPQSAIKPLTFNNKSYDTSTYDIIPNAILMLAMARNNNPHIRQSDINNLIHYLKYELNCLMNETTKLSQIIYNGNYMSVDDEYLRQFIIIPYNTMINLLSQISLNH